MSPAQWKPKNINCKYTAWLRRRPATMRPQAFYPCSKPQLSCWCLNRADRTINESWSLGLRFQMNRPCKTSQLDCAKQCGKTRHPPPHWARPFSQEPGLNQKSSCWKRTIDISGDGKNNTGPEPHQVNLPEQISDIVINALIIGVDAGSRMSHAKLSIGELTAYFSNRVLARPRAFSVVAIGFGDYERDMSHKLLRELEFISMSQLDQ